MGKYKEKERGSTKRSDNEDAGVASAMSELDLLFRTSSDGLYILDREGHAIRISETFARLLGYDPNELLGKPVSFWNAQWKGHELEERFRLVRDLPPGKSKIFETLHRRKDGSIIPVEIHACRFDTDGKTLLLHSVRDISGRQKADNLIRRLSAFNILRSRIAEAAASSRSHADLLDRFCRILIRHAKFRLAWVAKTEANGSFVILSATGPPDLLEHIRNSGKLGIPSLADLCAKEQKAQFDQIPSFQWTPKGRPPKASYLACLPLFRKNHLFGILTLVSRDKTPFDPPFQRLLQNMSRTLSRGLDQVDVGIREREQASLQTALLDNTVSGILLTRNRRIRFANRTLLTMMGYDRPSELLGKTTRCLFLDSAEFDRIGSLLPTISPGSPLELSDMLFRKKNGKTLPCDLSITVAPDPDGQGQTLVATIRDSSFRHRQMQHLERLSDFNTLLAKVGEAVAKNTDELSLFHEVCSLAVTYAGLSLCWVGRPGPEGHFLFLASAGKTGYLKDLRIPGDPEDPGQGSAGPTFREGKAIFNPSFTGRLHPWKAVARKWGLEASATLPLFRCGRVFAVLAVYHDEENAFDASLQEILLELGRCLSRGLDRIDLLAGERQTSALNSAILEASSLGILLTKNGRILYANSRMESIFHHPLASICGHSILSYCSIKELPSHVNPLLFDPSRRGESVLLELPVLRKGEEQSRWLEFSGVPFRQEGFDTLWTVSDVTARRQSREGENLLANALRSVQEGVVITDSRCRILYVNEAFFTISGYTREEVVGQTCRFLQGPDTAPETLEEIRRALQEGRSFRGQLLNYRKDMSPFWNLLTISPVRDPAGTLTHFVGVQRDITDMRELLDQNTRLAFRAHHDPLTGIANRSALNDHLDRLISRVGRHGGTFAIGMIDLDDFKPVNDTWGHASGDRLLGILAQRLGRSLRAHDLLARLGGDEFVVVIEDLGDGAENQVFDAIIERIHSSVESPFEIAPGNAVHIGMSMGVAFFPRDGENPDTLLMAADDALSQIKRNKHKRTRWWQIAGSPFLEEERHAFDPYGAETAAILKKNAPLLEKAISCFVDAFYAHLKGVPEIRKILDALNDEEKESLIKKQTDSLNFLLSPRATQEKIRLQARQTGQIHCLVGLSNKLLVGNISQYRRLLAEHLYKGLIPDRDRSLLLSVADLRFDDHVEMELESEISTISQYMEAAISHSPGFLGGSLAEWEVDRLSRLPGIRGLWLFRMHDTGGVMIEACSGNRSEEFLRHIENAEDPFPDAMAGRIVRHSSLEIGVGEKENRLEALHSLDCRSSAEIPLCDPIGRCRYILLIGGQYPNQFASSWMQQFTIALKQRLESSPLFRDPAPDLLFRKTQEDWMETLLSGNLLMHMQPVVDLEQGRLHSFEALARLDKGEGNTLSARVVLSRMNLRQAARLFKLGLAQGLDSLARLKSVAPETALSINIPPDLIVHPDLVCWIDEMLERTGVSGNRLILEISKPHMGDGRRLAGHLSHLKKRGILIGLDDLGSSHSDLELLATLPCDLVKISGDFTDRLRIAPLETLSLLQSLRLSAEKLGAMVILKGLSDPALVESAVISGFTHGQGYAIASPQSPEDILAVYPPFFPSGRKIKSALGALSFLWNGMQDLALKHPAPLSLCPLTPFFADHPESRGNAPEKWHEDLHEADSPRFALRNLLEWLVEIVQEELGIPPDCL